MWILGWSAIEILLFLPIPNEYRVARTGLQNRLRPVKARKITGTIINLYGLYGDNYWHFIYDCLAKLYILTQAEPGTPVTIPLPAALSQTARETLEAAMPDQCTIRTIPKGEWVHAERILFLSFASRLGNGHLPAVVINYLRDTIFRRLGMEIEEKPSERIYISRAGAHHRRVLNEAEVMDCLSRYGFNLVRLERLSFREQVNLFRKAQIVAGPAGARAFRHAVRWSDRRGGLSIRTSVPILSFSRKPKGWGKGTTTLPAQATGKRRTSP